MVFLKAAVGTPILNSMVLIVNFATIMCGLVFVRLQ